jgi:uncharacterized Zn-binding protein involved in type VI secretion
MPKTIPAAVACVGDVTDPVKGEFGTVAFPKHEFGKIVGASTVMAQGRPVATVGSLVTPHGNFDNPKMPGYNPECAKAIVTGFNAGYNVLVEGRPIAVIGGTMCSCTHFIVGPGAPTVMVGKVA